MGEHQAGSLGVKGSNPLSSIPIFFEKGFEKSEVRDCDKSEQSQRVADPKRSES